MRLSLFVLGAFVGAPTRYVIDTYFRSYTKFPLGIVIVNVSGSFLLGLVIESGSDIAYGLTGFCGALTTWSAFALDLFEEVDKKDFRSFTLNLLTNYGLGVLAAALGIWVAS